MLQQKNFSIVAVYRILCWDAILNDIYKSTFIKSNTVEEHVLSHAYINKYLFGNCGLILLLHKNLSYGELVNDTLQVKMELRQDMNKTKDGTIYILLNTNRSIYNSSPIQKKRMVNTFLSYIHCPDTIEQYFEDFKILKDYLKSDNKLHSQEIEKIIKYRSYYYNG
jgi:hypothetical protein